jgi:hypothetical protein
MKDWRFVIALAGAWGLGISVACLGSDILGSFFGVFVGVFTSFTLIIALSHVLCLLLPKMGIGSARDSG